MEERWSVGDIVGFEVVGCDFAALRWVELEFDANLNVRTFVLFWASIVFGVYNVERLQQ